MSIHKTANGRFMVRWRIDGKQYSKTFRSKCQATQFDSTLDGISKPLSLDREIGFESFTTKWLANYAAARKMRSSIDEDARTIKKYFGPAFGQRPLKSITAEDVESLRGEILRQHDLQPKTVNNIFGLLNRIFVIAQRWHYVEANPCAALERLRVHKSEMKFWTFDELAHFLAVAKTVSQRAYDIVALASNTGMRYGEICGLFPDCLDFNRSEIVVTRTFCSREKKVLQRTKGMTTRRIPMNALVREVCQRRKGDADKPIFPGFNRSNFAKRDFEPLIKKAAVRRIRFHDLRHTFGSHLAMRGVPILKIKEMMGHSDIKVTMGYMHLAPSELQGVTDVLVPAGLRNGGSNVIRINSRQMPDGSAWA